MRRENGGRIEREARTRVFRPPSPRNRFTLTPDLCPLIHMESRPLLAAGFHMCREFKVDMSEFVYSFARGMLNIKPYPERWKGGGR